MPYYQKTLPIVEKDAASYGQAVTRFGVPRIVRQSRVQNRVERWIQKLEHRIDTYYVPFEGHDVITANDWHWQFVWVWNVCLRQQRG